MSFLHWPIDMVSLGHNELNARWSLVRVKKICQSGKNIKVLTWVHSDKHGCSLPWNHSTWLTSPGYQSPAIQERSLSRADSRFAPSQWETALLCNDVSHWLGANLELALLSTLYRCKSFWGNHHKYHTDRQLKSFLMEDNDVTILQSMPWASYRIRKIAGCACAANVFPATEFEGSH